jgi:hypothetical protein
VISVSGSAICILHSQLISGTKLTMDGGLVPGRLLLTSR